MKKQKKLTLERFKIAKLNNPKIIYGGTDGNGGGGGDTQTEDKNPLSTLVCLGNTNDD